MIYAQFFQKSAISDEIIEACGDRSVVIIDARLKRETIGQIAAEECKRRGLNVSFTRISRAIFWRLSKMMRHFSVYKTSRGRAIFVIDTSRYDGFWGFNRLLGYLEK